MRIVDEPSIHISIWPFRSAEGSEEFYWIIWDLAILRSIASAVEASVCAIADVKVKLSHTPGLVTRALIDRRAELQCQLVRSMRQLDVDVCDLVSPSSNSADIQEEVIDQSEVGAPDFPVVSKK